MYVEISNGQARVHDPDDCTSLEVRVAAGGRADVDTALRTAGLGTWSGDGEAALAVTALGVAAGAGEVGADWTQRWDAMIAYAARKGWLSDDGTLVSAHLVDVD